MYNNELATQKISKNPKQQIYFDNIAPTVNVGEITGDVNSGEFCIPLNFSDGKGTVSDFDGLTASFAWCYDQDKQIPFKYAVTTSADTPSEYKESVLNNENNLAWNKFDLPVKIIIYILKQIIPKSKTQNFISEQRTGQEMWVNSLLIRI